MSCPLGDNTPVEQGHHLLWSTTRQQLTELRMERRRRKRHWVLSKGGLWVFYLDLGLGVRLSECLHQKRFPLLFLISLVFQNVFFHCVVVRM